MRFILYLLIALLMRTNSVLYGQALGPVCGIPSELDYFLNCFAEKQNDVQLQLVLKNIEYDCHSSIEKIYLLFDLPATPNFQQARNIITNLAVNFLTEINKQEKLGVLFSSFPLKIEQIDIQVRFRNPDCGFIYPEIGNIASVSTANGQVQYDTLNSYTYKINILRRESFSEALKKGT
jgi:hypothetical protein